MFTKQDNIDYLAELVVSNLMTNKGIADKHIFVHLLGTFNRFFSNDIENSEVHKTEANDPEFHFYLNREGLYDFLPEGFFHSHSHKYYKNRIETKNEFRQHRIEEQNARRFFMPLEQEFFSYLLQKENFEQDFFYEPETIREFIDFFDLDRLILNMYQKASLFFLLPHIPKIAGNLALTETCFEIILQEKVRFKTDYNSYALIPENELVPVHKNKLGVNTFLGNKCIDLNPRLTIAVGPLQQSDSLIRFLNGSEYQLMNRLAELFIEADLTFRFEVFLNEQDSAFVFGKKDYEARLKYSTTL